ncbi:MAG: divalent metal cation transporter [Chlorobi bacterium]|nr:divalent metal cation transporter [Chlorobiota bacterium]
MKKILQSIGPGIVVAATGIGAGDMIAATVGGAKYGYLIIWAVVLGAVLKYVLNEGVGRWQLVNNMSLAKAWIIYLPKFVAYYFLIYLLLWSFIVFAALMAASGLAAYALTGMFSVKIWGGIHSVVALLLVLPGNYRYFENIMKIIIAMMFVVVIASVVLLKPDFYLIAHGILNPILPHDSVKYALAIIGGVGGSVTILSYGYWIKEKSWEGEEYLPKMKVDLALAYLLTGLFGIAVIIIAADLKPEIVSGSGIVLALADKLGGLTGSAGRWIFLFGFWAAVFSSMIGVWQGVPYIFADFTRQLKGDNPVENNKQLSNAQAYRLFLLFMAIVPYVLLFMGKPVWLIIVYAVAGSLFMPFLAFTLLWLNNKKSLLKSKKNGIVINVLLIINLLLFLYLGIMELLKYI